MSGAIFGYERPPYVQAADISGIGSVSTLGRSSQGFALQQQQAQAMGTTPINTAAGPVYAGVPGGYVAIGILVALALAYWIHHRHLD
jgi:hypothetical protein